MNIRFRNRDEAGKLLAEKLMMYANNRDVLVLALPRGGVPVAVAVSHTLNVAWDMLLVRKLGVPGASELAMGAVAYGDLYVLNEDIIKSYGIEEREINTVLMREKTELARRNQLYRSGRPSPQLDNRIIIIVDDGIATGATMKAAVKAIKQFQPKKIIVAVPVAPYASLFELSSEADEVICLNSPSDFMSVGEWYQEFKQLSDEELLSYVSESPKTDF
jgi:predicted phosphoribosyltransferase